MNQERIIETVKLKPCFLLHYAGLGNTVKEIDVSDAKVFPKTVFSMVIPEVEELLVQQASRKSVVLFGIEVGACREGNSTLYTYHTVQA